MRAVGQAARADPSRHGVVRLVADGAREGVAGAARSEQRGVARRRGVRVLRGVSERLDQGQTPARFALEEVLVSGRSAPRGALKPGIGAREWVGQDQTAAVSPPAGRAIQGLRRSLRGMRNFGTGTGILNNCDPEGCRSSRVGRSSGS